MGHTEEALAEFKCHNPNAISHIKRLNKEMTSLGLFTPTTISTPLPTLLRSMTTHGEDIVLEEGEVVEAGQDKQAIPLPIPPHVTPPIPTVPFLSVSEQIEGNGPWQEAIMATLM